MSLPIIESDAVPENTLYMLPPDVMKAIETVEEITARALEALLVYCLAPRLYGQFWPYVIDELRRTTEQKFRAIDSAYYGAKLTIHAAALENRIGVIINIGE